MQGGHYNGCWSDMKKNGTRRVIDYERGYDCIASTDKQCWTSTKMKYLKRRPYYTRQRVAIHDKVRKELIHEVKKAIYDTLANVHKQDFCITAAFKILFVKGV